ncbi:MAG: hypothetical protein WB755_21435 [Terriglobales bacterium]
MTSVNYVTNCSPSPHTTTQVAVQKLVRAMAGGTQPPLRTLIDMASYPSLEKLSAKRKHAAAGA